MKSKFLLQDGIIFWYDGPEWDAVVEEVFKEKAPEVEAIAQMNAPWDDRTGAARAGLHATVENIEGVVALELAHGVEYGFWLEVIQNGKFAIILPTLETLAPSIVAEATTRVKNARKGKNF